MRNSLVAILLLFASVGYAQDAYYYSGWGKIRDTRDQKVSPSELRMMYANDYDVIQLYNSGRRRLVVGNVLMVTGGVVTLGHTLPALFTTARYHPYVGIAGGVLLVTGVVVKIGYRKKIEHALHYMNVKERKDKYMSYIESSDIIVNANGIGVSVTF